MAALTALIAEAATVLGADSGEVFFCNGDLARVLAAHNSPRLFHVYRNRSAERSFPPSDTVLCTDVLNHPGVRKYLSDRASVGVKLFVRLPFLVTPQSWFSLHLAGTTVRPAFTGAQKNLLDGLTARLSEICAPLQQWLKAKIGVPAFPIRFVDLLHIVRTSPRALILRDNELRVVETSIGIKKGSQFFWRRDYGESPSEDDPISGTNLEKLYRRILRDGVTAPEMEIIMNVRGDADQHLFAVRAMPVIVNDMKAPLLMIEARHVRSNINRAAPPPAPLLGPSMPSPLGSVEDFLLETLVKRPAVHNRKSVSFLTVRSWRSTIKEYQIKAFRALKRNEHSDFADAIAEEMLQAVEHLTGLGAYHTVVPMPPGHSNPEACLSIEIARALARSAGLPLVHAFASQSLPGSSHPKANVSRPPLKRIRYVDGPVILVDDVATSGQHLEEAAILLRQTCSSVLPLAWISGSIGEAKKALKKR